MREISDVELTAAEDRGRMLAEAGPRAIDARYDRERGLVTIELANGCLYGFPPGLIEDLAGAGPQDLAGVTVDGAGFNLNFPDLDVDLFVPGIVAGLFGSRAWMARLQAAEAGRSRSAAKAAAARINGAKGGRPRKSARA